MRYSPLLLLVTLLSQCSGVTGVSTSQSHAVPPAVRSIRPSRELSLRRGEQRTFAPGALRPGDVLTCELAGQRLHIRIPNRPGVAWSAGTGAATPGGSSAQLQVSVSSDGSATASCGNKSS